MATDVAVKAVSANPVLNGNIVTQTPKANAGAFKDNNVDTGPTDDRGDAVTDVGLDADLTARFNNPRYYTGDLVT